MNKLMKLTAAEKDITKKPKTIEMIMLTFWSSPNGLNFASIPKHIAKTKINGNM